MCRLLAFSAIEATTIPAFVGPNIAEFIELSNIHHDAWGLAIDNGVGTNLVKTAETASKSETFAEMIGVQAGIGGLLHFRWASPGLPVTDQNAHPFSYKEISFIHNGALSPYDTLQSLVSSDFLEIRKGQTDSELFFLYLLTEIEKDDFLSGVTRAIKNIKENFKYSSINSMIMNPDYLVVISEHDPENKPSWADAIYYELRYRLDQSGFTVASSGWPQEGWELIPNHQILVFNRKTLQLEKINL